MADKRKQDSGRYEGVDTTYIDRSGQTKKQKKAAKGLKKMRKKGAGAAAHAYGSALSRRMKAAGL